MFLIEAPFVSEFLKQTLEEFNISVIKTVYAEQALQGYSVNFISELEAVQAYESDKQLHFYTNSENALDWILQNFPYSDLARKVASLKDKVRFRDVLVELHPKYFYRVVNTQNCRCLNRTLCHFRSS
jgi:vacuolar-type H+-ATPase subunit C/Vma6